MLETSELALLTVSDFVPVVGKPFCLATDESSPAITELLLREAIALPRHAAGHRDPFCLIFEGSNQQPVGQGVYFLENSEVGKLPIFIVPVGATADTLSYEAIFN